MKTNKQIFRLMEHGFKPSTLERLNERQINVLYNRLVEQVIPQQKTTYKIEQGGGTLPSSSKGYNISVNKSTNTTTATPIESEMKEGDDVNRKIDKSELRFLKNLYKKTQSEKIKNMIVNLEKELSKGEMKEGDSLDALSMQDYTGQEGPHDERDMAPDGMDDDSSYNRRMMGESRRKKSQNPWAICTSTMGKEFGTTERSDWSKPQMKKYERCVMDVKKSIKEGKHPYESILENKILSLIERDMLPRMTKSELLRTISERKEKMESAPAPVKPDTDVKPGKKERRRPGYTPGPDPRPKARRERMESAPAPVKPDTDVKPGEKQRRRPGYTPGPDPRPKASSKSKEKYMSIISKILRQ